MAYVEKQIARLDLRLRALETILSKHKYLAGDKLTLADLFALPYGQGAVNASNATVVKAWHGTEYPLEIA